MEVSGQIWPLILSFEIQEMLVPGNYFEASQRDDLAERVVLVDKKKQQIEVDGSQLVLQLAYHNNFVVFLLGAVVYENALFIYYLNEELKILDTVAIQHPYATDDFRLERIVQPNIIQFDFLLEHQIWELRLNKKSALQWNNPFSLVKRPGIRSRSYFQLQKITK